MKLTKRGEWIAIGILIFLAIDAIRYHLAVTNGKATGAPEFIPIPMAAYGTTYKGR